MSQFTETDEPVYDKEEQLEKIQQYTIPGERIHAVLDMKGGGTGFLGLTDRRLIFYDKAFVQRYKAMVTIPYTKISLIGSEDEEGFFTRGSLFGSSKLRVHVGPEAFEFEFRGADKAHLAYQIIVSNL